MSSFKVIGDDFQYFVQRELTHKGGSRRVTPKHCLLGTRAWPSSWANSLPGTRASLGGTSLGPRQPRARDITLFPLESAQKSVTVSFASPRSEPSIENWAMRMALRSFIAKSESWRPKHAADAPTLPLLWSPSPHRQSETPRSEGALNALTYRPPRLSPPARAQGTRLGLDSGRTSSRGPLRGDVVTASRHVLCTSLSHRREP